MCYLLAAITVMPRGMDGDSKQMKEEKCLVSLSLSFRFIVFSASNMALA